MFKFSQAKFKAGFFDRPEIRSKLDAYTQRKLSSLGAFVRTAARSLLRRRKRVSMPGEPPSIRTKDPVATLKNIQFAYDPSRKTVVIGPIALNRLSIMVGGGPGQLQVGVVPAVLEHGGTVGVRELRLKDGRWVPIGWRKKLGETLVPVWRATSEQKRLSKGTRTVYDSTGHAVNFYILPGESKSRIRYATVAARPFMAPGAEKGLADWKRKLGLEPQRVAA